VGNARPFRVDIPDYELDRVKRRVREYEWFEEPVDAGWKYGCNQAYLRALCDYWLDGYDWRAAEAELNRFPQFKAEVDGIDIHFVHERGSNPANRPLVLLHGWPGSYYELLHLTEALAHPERTGGRAEDGRDVVIPSLVGYGFSGPPPKPIGPRAQARFMNGLMTGVLGYDRYVVQGGDWGALIAGWLGFDFGADKGGPLHAIHVNLIGVRPAGPNGAPLPPETEEERAWAARAEARMAVERGYFMVQGTKPQSLSYAMMDSPVGVAAWLTEKFHTWSDLSGEGKEGGELDNVFSKHQLLTNIMLYVVTRRFNTAAWQYYGVGTENGFAFPPGQRCQVPTGVASYPREIAPVPPRSYAEKGYNVVHWTEQPKGGHFAAFEQPEIFLDDLNQFLKSWG
jgi:pimeloyl-ACP methyl ester carboxylesterase